MGIRDSLIRLLGGTPPKPKTCRREGPLPGGGYQPQSRCGECEECLARRPAPKHPSEWTWRNSLTCPRPPEDHWTVRVLIRFSYKEPQEFTAKFSCPEGAITDEMIGSHFDYLVDHVRVLGIVILSKNKTTTAGE